MATRNEVGTAYVIIRGITKNVKKDVTKSFRDAFKGLDKEAHSAGFRAGKKWGVGFTAGVKSEGTLKAITGVWHDVESEAANAGRRAGERYAASYNSAIKRSSRENRPNLDTQSQDAVRQSAQTARQNEQAAQRASQQARASSQQAANAQRQQQVNSRNANKQSGLHKRWENNKTVTTVHRVVTDIKSKGGEEATKILGHLGKMLSAIGPLAMVAAGGLAGLGGQGAITGIAGVIASLSQMAGLLGMMPALITSVGAAFGTLKIGSMGIGKAIGAGWKASSKGAAQAEADAEGVENAQRGVLSAIRGREAAERALNDAVKNRARLQDAYTKAIQAAGRELEDYNLKLKGSAIDEEDAIIGVARAKERLANMPADSTALDWREARNQLKRARLSLEETRKSNGRLNEDAKVARDKGIKGNDQVVAAKDAIKDADQAIIDAQNNLADATRGVTDAQKQLAKAMKQAAGQTDEFTEAMNNLAPSAREFVQVLLGMKGRLEEFQKAVQQSLFKGLGPALKAGLGPLLDTMQPALERMAGILNGIGKDALKSFTNPTALGQFSKILSRINDMFESMRPAFGSFMNVWKNLSIVGSEFLGRFSKGFVTGAKNLESWTANFDKVRGAIDNGFTAAGQWWSMLKNIGSALIAIFSPSKPKEFMSTMVGVTEEFRNFTRESQTQEKLAAFYERGRAALREFGPILKQIMLGLVEIGTRLAQLGEKMAPGLLVFFTGLREGIARLGPGIEKIGPAFSRLFEALGKILPSVGDTLSSLASGIAPLITGLSWVVEKIAPPFLAFIRAIAPAITPIVVAIGGMVIAWKLFNKAADMRDRFKKSKAALSGFMNKEKETESQVDQTKTALNEQGRAQSLKGESADDLSTKVNRLKREEDDLQEEVDDTADALKRAQKAAEQRKKSQDIFGTQGPAPDQEADDLARDNQKLRGKKKKKAGFGRDENGDPVGFNDQWNEFGLGITGQDQKNKRKSKAGRRMSKFGHGLGIVSNNAVEEASNIGTGAMSIRAGLKGIGNNSDSSLSGELTKAKDALKSGDFGKLSQVFQENKESISQVGFGVGRLKEAFVNIKDASMETFSNLSHGFRGADDGAKKAAKSANKAGDSVKKVGAKGKIMGSLTKFGPKLASGFKLLANPIGLVVLAIGALVAGLVIAYKKSETFRKFVDGVWNGIKRIVSDVWNNTLKPIFTNIVNWIKEFVTEHMGTFKAIWNGVLLAVQTYVKVWWAVVSNVFKFLVNLIKNVIAPVITWWWQNVVAPAFKAIGAIIGFVWNNVIKPAFEGFKIAMRILGTIISWTWNNLIKPVWDGLGKVIGWVIDKIVQPAFERLKSGLTGVKDFFSTIVDTIKSLWDRIKEIAAKPVNFVIDTVYNNGIAKAWNKIAGIIGLDDKKLDRIEPIKFAKGGAVRGGTPNKDSVYSLLMPGEVVMNKRAVRALGMDNLLHFNRVALGPSSVSGEGLLPRRAEMAKRMRYPVPMAKGGSYEEAMKVAHRFAREQNGKPYLPGNQHPKGADCSGFMSSIAGMILNRNPKEHWSTVAFPQGQANTVNANGQRWERGLGKGFSIGMSGGPASGGQNGHTAGTLSGIKGFPTVNVESGGGHGNIAYGGPAVGADNSQFSTRYHLPITDGMFESGGKGGGFFNRVQQKITDLVVSPLRKLLDNIPDFGKGGFAEFPKRFAKIVVDKIIDFIQKRDTSDSEGKEGDDGLYDQGGWLKPGRRRIRNKTGKPEPVFNPRQWNIIKRNVDAVEKNKEERDDSEYRRTRDKSNDSQTDEKTKDATIPELKKRRKPGDEGSGRPGLLKPERLIAGGSNFSGWAGGAASNYIKPGVDNLINQNPGVLGKYDPNKQGRTSIGTHMGNVASSFISGQLGSGLGYFGLDLQPPVLDAIGKYQQDNNVGDTPVDIDRDDRTPQEKREDRQQPDAINKQKREAQNDPAVSHRRRANDGVTVNVYGNANADEIARKTVAAQRRKARRYNKV